MLMMIPPSYLLPYTRITEQSDTEITLRLICPCGSESFEFLFHEGGDKNERGEETTGPFQIQYRNHFFFVIKVKCINCGHILHLFDSHLNGYDALIAGWPSEDPGFRPAMKSWICRKCKSKNYIITLWIEGCDKEEILEIITNPDKNTKIDESRWQDAFEWINIYATCIKCKTQAIVEFECA
jgi:hypothetical protein